VSLRLIGYNEDVASKNNEDVSSVVNIWFYLGHLGGLERKRETTQAAKHSLNQLRKRRHIGPI